MFNSYNSSFKNKAGVRLNVIMQRPSNYSGCVDVLCKNTETKEIWRYWGWNFIKKSFEHFSNLGVLDKACLFKAKQEFMYEN